MAEEPEPVLLRAQNFKFDYEPVCVNSFYLLQLINGAVGSSCSTEKGQKFRDLCLDAQKDRGSQYNDR